MTRGLLFWVLMILWLVFGIFYFWPSAGGSGFVVFAPMGNHLLEFVLFAIVGWQVFGPAVKG
jgi:hypothetical protein